MTKSGDPYTKMFSTSSRVRVVFWISLQLDIPYPSIHHSQVITYVGYVCTEISGSYKKLLHVRVVWASLWLVSYSWDLRNKNCIVRKSAKLTIWMAFCYSAGSMSQDGITGARERTAIKSCDDVWYATWWTLVDLLVFIISGDFEFWGSCVRRSWINWYFQRSMVSLNLCKACLNNVGIKNMHPYSP